MKNILTGFQTVLKQRDTDVCHGSSLSETIMRRFKLFSERVTERDFERQVAMLQVRAPSSFLHTTGCFHYLDCGINQLWVFSITYSADYAI